MLFGIVLDLAWMMLAVGALGALAAFVVIVALLAFNGVKDRTVDALHRLSESYSHQRGPR